VRGVGWVAGPVAGVVAGWVAPLVLGVPPVREWMRPGLAGRGRARHVALTFDDGPDPEGTPRVLEALDRLGWTATFFLLGSQVARYPRLAAQVVAAGHEVAVHGFTHRSHLVRGPADVTRDVDRAARLVADVTGQVPVWFRPPYGVLTAASLVAARRAGLRTVLWTAWGRDWEGGSGGRVAAIVAQQLRPGGTVLLHDSDCTSAPGSWQATVAALPLLARLIEPWDCAVGPLREHF